MARHSLPSAWIAGVALYCLAAAQPVAAQAPRGFLHVNGVYPASAPPAFETTLETPLFEETAVYSIREQPRQRVYYDATVGGRVWEGVAAAVSVSFREGRSPALVSGSIPSPLVFGSARNASFSTRLNRRHVGVHLQAVYYLPTPSGIDVALSAGPSLLRVTRDAVSSVTPGAESLPFDTVAIAGVGVTALDENGIGANVGADVAFMATRAFGVGILIRYVSGPSADRQQSAVEGVQAAAGLRFRF